MAGLICFTLDDTRYAVPAGRVIEIIARVLITPLPDAKPPVLGVFSYRGAPVPAVDLRARLGHPPRPPARDDHFILARAARRDVALVVDRVGALETIDDLSMRPAPVPSRHVAGVVSLPDGLLLIEDLDAVLSLEEEAAIDAGLAHLGAPT